ncbi:MAG: hypothetical protein ABW165_11630, partial [Candidatus Thiodiazotropha sp.]
AKAKPTLPVYRCADINQAASVSIIESTLRFVRITRKTFSVEEGATILITDTRLHGRRQTVRVGRANVLIMVVTDYLIQIII